MGCLYAPLYGISFFDLDSFIQYTFSICGFLNCDLYIPWAIWIFDSFSCQSSVSIILLHVLLSFGEFSEIIYLTLPHRGEYSPYSSRLFVPPMVIFFMLNIPYFYFQLFSYFKNFFSSSLFQGSFPISSVILGVMQHVSIHWFYLKKLLLCWWGFPITF